MFGWTLLKTRPGLPHDLALSVFWFMLYHIAQFLDIFILCFKLFFFGLLLLLRPLSSCFAQLDCIVDNVVSQAFSRKDKAWACQLQIFSSDIFVFNGILEEGSSLTRIFGMLSLAKFMSYVGLLSVETRQARWLYLKILIYIDKCEQNCSLSTGTHADHLISAVKPC